MNVEPFYACGIDSEERTGYGAHDLRGLVMRSESNMQGWPRAELENNGGTVELLKTIPQIGRTN